MKNFVISNNDSANKGVCRVAHIWTRKARKHLAFCTWSNESKSTYPIDLIEVNDNKTLVELRYFKRLELLLVKIPRLFLRCNAVGNKKGSRVFHLGVHHA